MSESCSFPCHLYMLYINEKGEIYPCPRAPQNNLIGYVYEPHIYHKIVNYEPNFCECSICSIRTANQEEKSQGVINTNIEIGGECNAACVYCFQKTLSTFRKHFPYFRQLKSFLGELSHLKFSTIFGGEVTIQPETLDIISCVKQLYGTQVTVVTNGYIPLKKYDLLCDAIENFQVSFYGFSDTSVRIISKMNLNVIKSFCNYVSDKHHSLDVKFIMSPMVIQELVPFLEWSVALNVSHVMIYYAILPSKDYEETGRRDVSSFDSLIPEYWGPIIERLAIEIKAFFIKNKALIKEKQINYIINHEVLNILHIPYTFLDELGISQEKSISISCKAWKPILENISGTSL